MDLQVSTPRRGSFRIFLARTLALGVAFAALKLLSVALAENSPENLIWSAVPWLVTFDLLAAAGMASLVFIRSSFQSVAAYFSLIYYVAAIHYQRAFGDFFTWRTLEFTDEMGALRSSVAEILDWRLLTALPLLMLLYGYVARMPLAGRRGRLAWVTAWLILVAGTWRAPNLHYYQIYRSNPFTRLAGSLGERLLSKELDSGFAAVTPGGFDADTIFERKPEALPHFLKSGKGLNLVVLLLESVSNPSRVRGGEDPMPNFSRLKEHGVYWPNFYAAQPNSLKSIFSFLSGYYPAADLGQISRVRPRIPLKLLPAYFKERGYRTAFLHSGTFAYYNKLAFLKDRGFDLLLDANSLPGRERYEHSSWGIDDRAVFDFAASWALEGNEPFLAVISLLLPHHPYDIPKGEVPRFGSQSLIDKYHSSLYYLDGLLGGFISALKAGAAFENTVFVIFADHGEAFGQHPHNFMHAAGVYEENVNVPLLISSPKLFDGAKTSLTVGTLPDILPTLCDLMRIELAGTPLDGSSLFSPHPKRMVFMSTHLNRDVLGLRDGEFKFIYQPLPETNELYNLSQDGAERENLAEKFPERVRFYRERAQAWADYSRGLTHARF